MSRKIVHRALLVGTAGMGVASIFLHDVDKSPIYFLLAYVMWRLG